MTASAQPTTWPPAVPVLPYLDAHEPAVDWNPWILRAGLIYAAASLLEMVCIYIEIRARPASNTEFTPLAITAWTVAGVLDMALLLVSLAALTRRLSVAAARRWVAGILAASVLSEIGWYVWAPYQSVSPHTAARATVIFVSAIAEIARSNLWLLAMVLTLRPSAIDLTHEVGRSIVPQRLLRVSIAVALVCAVRGSFQVLWTLAEGRGWDGIVQWITGSASSGVATCSVLLALTAAVLYLIALRRTRRRVLVLLAVTLLVMPGMIWQGAMRVQSMRSGGARTSPVGIDLVSMLSSLLYTAKTVWAPLVLAATLWWRRAARWRDASIRADGSESP